MILTKGKKELLVEIVVTNDINSEKYEKIISSNVSVLKIDLSNNERKINTKIEYDILYNPNNRNWIHNHVKEEYKYQLIKEKLNSLKDFIQRKANLLNYEDKLVWDFLIKNRKSTEFINQFKKYIIPRFSKKHGRVQHVDPCPEKIKYEEWCLYTYANIELDCISSNCPYFYGFFK